MQKPIWYLHRLRSMNLSEVLWRIRSLISSYLEMLIIPVGRYPKLRLESWSLVPGFRCSPVGDQFRSNRNASPFNFWADRLFSQADNILENKLSIFDLRDQFLGDPVDWHRDFSASRSSPKILSNLIDYRDFGVVGDCKLVWEPNRHHQLVVLARAWNVSGDERYADKVVEQLDHWIDANPFGYGMNWKSPLEISVRLINWVWAIDLIRDSRRFDEAWLQKVLNAAYLAMWETQRKFSRGSSANNHLIGEAAGVFIACCYFDKMPNSREWRLRAQEILEREILAQTFHDGCTREHAFGYQFFVVQFLTLSLLAGDRSGAFFSVTYRNRLQQMYRFMTDICADTGRSPDFGDADDGYVLDLGEKPADASQLLSVGACLFNDDAIENDKPSESAFWLFGEAAASSTGRKFAQKSSAYRESGYFVLRSTPADGESRSPLRVFFDCAELGFGPIAAHGHADCLSFALSVDGREILVDPGTYDYFSHPTWRRYFRSTLAHNTVCIDDRCQSESLGPFLWGRRANARIIDWQDTESLSRIIGEHDGYTRLADPVIHRRSLTVHKISNRVEILDTITAKAPHRIRVCFHVAPESTITTLVDGVIIEHSDVRLRLSSPGCSVYVHKADDSDFRGWISTGYHRRRPGHFIGLEVNTDNSAAIATQIDISRNKNK